MKRQNLVGMTVVAITMATVEQTFGSVDSHLVIPTLAMSGWVLPVVGLAILILAGILYADYYKKWSRPGKTSPPVKKNVSAGNFFDRKPAPGQLTTAGRPTEATVQPQPGQAVNILSMAADPAGALSAVKALALQKDPEAVDALTLALGYCQIRQISKDLKGLGERIPNEFVRQEVAQALGRSKPGALRDLAQVMQAIEAVCQEVARKENEAGEKRGELGKQQYYVCLTEVLQELFGLLEAYLNNLPLGGNSLAQIAGELPRFEDEAGQPRDPGLAEDPIYGLLKKKQQALMDASAPIRV